MRLQYEFDMTKNAGDADAESAAAKKRMEAYVKMLQEKKERAEDAEQN